MKNGGPFTLVADFSFIKELAIVLWLDWHSLDMQINNNKFNQGALYHPYKQIANNLK